MGTYVYAVAMTEVQDDSVICNAAVAMSYEQASAAAEAFMLRCVGDFYEIDPADAEGRRRKRDELMVRVHGGQRNLERLELTYEAQGLVLAATVQETYVP